MTEDRFPLAYSTLGCPAWSFEHAAEQAAKYGYKALEVRIYNGDIIPADLSQSERASIRRILAKNNIGIVGLGASTRFAFPDAEARQSNVDQLNQYIELAADLEVPLVRTFGSPGQIEISMDDAINYCAEALNAVAPNAERLGVSVALETHDAFCKGVDVAAVLAQVQSDSIGAIWDVHHPFRMGEDIETTWRDTWQLVLLGTGEVPCRAVVELLNREGYQGYIAAEWEKKWHPEIEEPEVALPQHAEMLRSWFAALPVSA